LLVNPTAHSGSAGPAFLTWGAIYFFLAQIFGFALGGHITGRLFFRHGGRIDRPSGECRVNPFLGWGHGGTGKMTRSTPIFRNEINALGDFRGRVKVARDFALS
jgi:hypothetical protein